MNRTIVGIILGFSLCQAAFFGQALGQINPPAPTNAAHLWKGEGNGTDYYGTADSVANNGVTFIPGKVGQGFNFDGANNYLDFGNSVGNFGTNDFSIGFWYQSSSLRGEYIMGKRIACDAGNFWTIGNLVNSGSNRSLWMQVYDDLTGANVTLYCTNRVNDGVFHHIVFTRQGQNVSSFTDGIADAKVVTPFIFNFFNSANFKMGTGPCVGVNGGSSFKGALDEVAFYDHALSEAEVQTAYTAASGSVNPPVPAETAHLWKGEGNGTDYYGTANSVANNGVTYIPGKVGQAFNFGGANNYLDFGNSVGNFGTNDFSIGFWYQSSSVRGEYVMGKRVTCNRGNFWTIGNLYNDSNRALWMEVYDDLTGANVKLLCTNRVNDGVFHHVVFTRQGQNVSSFIDGIPNAKMVTPFVFNFTNTANFKMGTEPCVSVNAGSSFKGVLDEVAFYDHALSEAEVHTEYEAASGSVNPPAPTDAVHLWKGESNGTDYYGTANCATNYGVAYVTGKVGQAFSFTGPNNYMAFGTNAGNFGSNDFTIEFWYQSTATQNRYVMGKRVECGAGNFWNVLFSGSQLSLELYQGVGGFNTSVPITKRIDDGVFHHIVFVRQGTNIVSFLDGIRDIRGSVPSTLNISNAANFVVGTGPCVGVNGDSSLQGTLDEIALYSRALSDGEIQTNYAKVSGTVNPPAPTDAAHLWKGEGNGADYYGTANSVISNGVAFVSGKVGQAFSFSGANNYMAFGTNAGNFGSNDFTIEFWYQSTATQNEYVLGKRLACGAGNFWNVLLSENHLYLELYQGAGAFNGSVQISKRVDDGGFHHIVFLRQGTNIVSYLDGIRDLSGSVPPTFNINNAANFVIGTGPCVGMNGLGSFRGVLDEVALYPRALSDAEIRTNYAKASGSVPPPAPMEPAHLWKGDGNGADYYGDANSTTNKGVTFVPGKVGQAFNFGGANNYMAFGTNAGNFGTNDFTIEFWYQSTATLNEYIMGKRVACGAGTFWNVLLSGNRLYLELYQGVGGFNTSVQVSKRVDDGGFHHIVFLRQGTNIISFLDGIRDLSGSVPSNLNLSNAASFVMGTGPCVGANGLGSFRGALDEVALYPRALSDGEIQTNYAKASGSVNPPAPIDTVHLWKGEGNGTDYYGTASSILSNGVTFVPGKIGQAFSFSGANNSMAFGTNAGNFGSNDFTIEFWYQSTATQNEYVLGKRVACGAGNFWNVLLSENHLNLELYQGAGAFNGSVQISKRVDDGGFHHIVFLRQGTNIVSYLDGIRDLSGSVPSSLNINNAANFVIGTGPCVGMNGLTSFRGVLDEVALYPRALSEGEIQTNYAKAPSFVNPPADMVNWWPGDGNGTDYLGSANSISNNGVTFVPGKVGQAFSFSGANNFVDFGPNAGNFGTNDFSIEFWYQSTSARMEYIMGKRVSCGAGSFWTVGLFSGLMGIELYQGVGEPHTSLEITKRMDDGVFHHVAFIRQGTNLIGFLDGLRDATAFTPNVLMISNAASFKIGTGPCAGVNGGSSLTGALDEICFYNRALTANEILAIYKAGGDGKARVPVAPQIVKQPVSKTTMSGASAVFDVIAAGTPSLVYQWYFNGAAVANGTNAALVIGNAFSSAAGSYFVTVKNSAGAVTSQVATLQIRSAPTIVRIVDTTSKTPEAIPVPLQLVASGAENAMSFSLVFNPRLLNFIEAVQSSTILGAQMILNTSEVSNGYLGIGIALPPGQTFPSGTQEVMQVIFSASTLLSSNSTRIYFGDQPTVRELVDAQANLVPAEYVSGLVSSAPMDYESDSSPRPNGNRAIAIADWVQVGRFVAGLDGVTSPDEFQRADCAPRSLRGDGHLTITDWVQAGRYAMELDPLMPVGGPRGEVLSSGLVKTTGGVNKAAVGPASTVVIEAGKYLVAGQPSSVYVVLTSQGEEHAMGFSLEFNSDAMSFAGAALERPIEGATLIINSNQIGAGRIGVALQMPAGTQVSASKQQILRLDFIAKPNAPLKAALRFSDAPVIREISDLQANAISANWQNTSVTILPPNTLPPVDITRANLSQHIIAWPADMTNVLLQSSETLLPGSWTPVTDPRTLNGDQNIITVPLSGQQKFYRIVKP